MEFGYYEPKKRVIPWKSVGILLGVTLLWILVSYYMVRSSTASHSMQEATPLPAVEPTQIFNIYSTEISYTGSGSVFIIQPKILPEDVVCQNHNCRYGLPLGTKLKLMKHSFTYYKQHELVQTCKQVPPELHSLHRTLRSQSDDPRREMLKQSKVKAQIKDLFDSWSIFADENEIPYWIADETLLGWHWGQKRLNWDTSIKVHLSFKLLYELQKYSGSIINDKYKFEINPNLERREYQVNNEIDATFTDIRTGYFVDIKGLGTRHLHVVHVHTKTPDFYRHKSIFPLVRTLFEGIPTWRPSNYSEILESKYGSSALTAKIFDKYKFDENQGKWVEMKTCVELFEAYIAPRMFKKLDPTDFPKYQWVSQKKDIPGAKSQCRVIETDIDGQIRTYDAVWNKYEDLALQRILKESSRNTKRQVLVE